MLFLCYNDQDMQRNHQKLLLKTNFIHAQTMAEFVLPSCSLNKDLMAEYQESCPPDCSAKFFLVLLALLLELWLWR